MYEFCGWFKFFPFGKRSALLGSVYLMKKDFMKDINNLQKHKLSEDYARAIVHHIRYAVEHTQTHFECKLRQIVEEEDIK